MAILWVILGLLTAISLGLTLWQIWAGARFPLHERVPNAAAPPPVTLLKPLKGCDLNTAACLRSWMQQQYIGPTQILFGVASADDPVCAVVRQLIAEHPGVQAELILCAESLGANAKVSTLIQLHRRARHDLLVISDADVRVPPELLADVAARFRDPAVGLVNCFYQLAGPKTVADQWEALAINADFWSQVLQARCLGPLDFALGAVMATTARHLEGIGGLAALADYLADDYQLGHLIARNRARIELSPIVVECWSPSMNWQQTWDHQLRWARTIRFCKPLPYTMSILSNASLWPALWLLSQPTWPVLSAALLCCSVRLAGAYYLQKRLTRSAGHLPYFWLAPIKDLLQFGPCLVSLFGRTVTWRGVLYRTEAGGKMVILKKATTG